MGSRFSDREDVRSDMNDANTAGRFFLERAELYLYYDLKYPTLTTIQALMILSNLSVSIGADATCWLRQGMAKTLAIDLGLNLDARRTPGADTMSPEEIALRRVLYWSMS
ncbi:fungal specific transcription factor domain-containing protein 15 [Elsinoe australis]|uniref:Fungal specific transcription factor domain-containing protein 15 n=1 Tax=Elsinoe australis TaxID=40998 RepID=A0A4U7BDI9_9PEZI|nr:fungal specific transcription factor domain-containing protein 15 [Elsinoe australis]